MPQITDLLAWIGTDEDGPDDEGVPIVRTLHGPMLLMGASAEIVQSWRPLAQKVADVTGRSIRLVRCTALEVVEVLEPREERPEGEMMEYFVPVVRQWSTEGDRADATIQESDR